MQGEKIEETELPPAIFDVPQNLDLVYQVVTSQLANRRRVIAHTKHRGEVSGGGRKPWAQKHTGRARHGSIRSPLWRKGGVVFGPRKNRVYKRKINEKMRKKALFAVLSDKAKHNFLIALTQLPSDTLKTKTLHAFLKKLPSGEKTSLLVLPNEDKNIALAARNISNLSLCEARNLNALDVISAQFVIFPKDSIEILKNTFAKYETA